MNNYIRKRLLFIWTFIIGWLHLNLNLTCIEPWQELGRWPADTLGFALRRSGVVTLNRLWLYLISNSYDGIGFEFEIIHPGFGMESIISIYLFDLVSEMCRHQIFIDFNIFLDYFLFDESFIFLHFNVYFSYICRFILAKEKTKENQKIKKNRK